MMDLSILRLVYLARRELAKRQHTARAAWSYFEDNFVLYRQNARHLGYALAVHGSLLRDVDLFAVPWTAEAKPADELVESFFKLAKALAGEEKIYVRRTEKPELKPHGRLAWSIWVNRDTYIDLSIMPIPEKEQ